MTKARERVLVARTTGILPTQTRGKLAANGESIMVSEPERAGGQIVAFNLCAMPRPLPDPPYTCRDMPILDLQIEAFQTGPLTEGLKAVTEVVWIPITRLCQVLGIVNVDAQVDRLNNELSSG